MCEASPRGFFREDILQQFTVRGYRDLPALPMEEQRSLKQLLFQQYPQFWKNRAEFEPVWNKCVEALNHSCTSLRVKSKIVIYM